MATYSITQMKKELKKLQKVGIVGERAILNLKLSELYKLKEQDKVSMKDIEIIWKIQEMIQDKSWFEVGFNIK